MGKDKATLPFGAESLRDRAVRLVREVTAEVVVCGRGGDGALDAVTLADAHPGAGPLVALLDAVDRLDAEWLVVVACDMPLLQPAVLRLLLEGADGRDACVPRIDGVIVPTCAVYRRAAVAAAGPRLRAEGASSLRALVECLDARVLDEDAVRAVDPRLLTFTPCNTPEQYGRALAAAGLAESAAGAVPVTMTEPDAVHDDAESLPLGRLLVADGAGEVTAAVVAAWYARVESVAETLDIGPGTRVFDATCGAGAFLLPLFENGYVVGGIDLSTARLALAGEAMPGGRFAEGVASQLDPAEAWDVVVVSRGFAGCAGADDVRGALARMVAKATHAVALLGLREEGGADRPPLGRAWLLRALAEQGVTAVRFEDDGDGAYRVLARV